MRVLVTGATGSVGPYVVSALNEAGYSVRTLSIDSPPENLWQNWDVESRIGDVADPSVVESAMSGISAVIHLAALLHIINPSQELKERYDRINVGGTQNVVDAANKAGVERIIYFSTISIYGTAPCVSVVNENSPAHPLTYYGQTKLAAERIVLNARNERGEPFGTVLRLGAVYGPRIKGNYYRLTRALARGRFVPVGNGCNRRTLVYVKDVARAALSALEQPQAKGRVYNVSDGEFHPLSSILAAICSGLDKRPPQFSLPATPIRLGAGAIETLARFCRIRPPITLPAIDKYMEDIAVSSARIQKELGFVAKYDLEIGWKETIREMRESGAL